MKDNAWTRTLAALELPSVEQTGKEFGDQVRNAERFGQIMSVDDLRILASAAVLCSKMFSLAMVTGDMDMAGTFFRTSDALKGMAVGFCADNGLINDDLL